MAKFLALCGAVLCLSVAAAARDGSGDSAVATASGPVSAAPAPRRSAISELYRWQVSISYEYFRANVLGTSLNLNGLNTSLTRYANDWLGLEADVGPVFGHTSDNQTAKFLWYGGGPHLAYRHKEKFEPWVHGLFGGGHLLPQTASGGLNAFAYVLGGGVDIKLSSRVYWRVQGDFVATHFFSDWQKNEQFKTGLVFNF